MNPRNGEIYALGSYPSFDANDLAKPISQAHYDELTSQAHGAPLFNRAIAATYPTGSIFKPITAIASLESGIVTPTQTINDDGKFKLGPQTFQNARGASYGALQMARAITVSSDVFFYTLGSWANARGPIIQRWARRLGLDRRTGIDLPGEFGGLVPDRRWRDAGYQKYLKCTQREHVTPVTTAALFKCGGIERPWSAGDNVNLAVGQGDLQATPLQMATVYSALATGGTVPRPHLGAAIEDGHGKVIQEIRKPRAPARQDRPALPGRDHAGPAGRHDRPEGHLRRRLQGLPAEGLRQDRHRRASGPGRSVVVRGLRAATRRARSSSWSRSRRAASAPRAPRPTARLILSKWFDVGRPRVQGRGARRPDERDAAAHPTGLDEPPPPLVPREWRLRLDVPLLMADARARGLLADRAQERDRRRRPRAAALLPLPPGGVRRRRG